MVVFPKSGNDDLEDDLVEIVSLTALICKAVVEIRVLWVDTAAALLDGFVVATKASTEILVMDVETAKHKRVKLTITACVTPEVFSPRIANAMVSNYCPLNIEMIQQLLDRYLNLS